MPRDREYIPGSFYRIDDKTGFKVRAEHTRKQWDNAITREESYEERHPQDFARGTSETEMKVHKPRPRQVDVHIGPLQTELTDASSAGSEWISVYTQLRFAVGDRITLMLSTGDTYWGYVQDVSIPGFMRISPPLPQAVVAGAPLTNLTIAARPNIG